VYNALLDVDMVQLFSSPGGHWAHGGGLQRSFVGSPWLCKGLRCLWMTGTGF